MPHYLALTYTEDVDWTAPEQADTLREYRQFGEQNRATIRSAAVLHPTGTATVVRVGPSNPKNSPGRLRRCEVCSAVGGNVCGA